MVLTRLRQHIILLLSVVLFFSSACSTQYRLERDIYHTYLDLQSLISRIKQAPAGEIESFRTKLDYLLERSKERGLEYVVRKMQLRLASASGDLSTVREILAGVRKAQNEAVYRKLLYDAFLYAVLDKHYNFAFRLLDKISAIAKNGESVNGEAILVSIPVWKCYVGLKIDDKRWCDRAISFYETKTKSKEAKNRFIGWRGLFLVYMILGEVGKSVDSLGSMVFDTKMPPSVILSSLHQQISILMRQREFDKVISTINRFLQVYKGRISEDFENQLKKLISTVEKIKQSLNEKNTDMQD